MIDQPCIICANVNSPESDGVCVGICANCVAVSFASEEDLWTDDEFNDCKEAVTILIDNVLDLREAIAKRNRKQILLSVDRCKQNLQSIILSGK